MFVTKTFLVALFLLLIGDYIATFFASVPEPVFGKFHSIVHHGKNRSFIDRAVLTKNPFVLLDRFLGALPYFLFIPWFWQLSSFGTILGLALGEFHVIWRHLSILNWQTPQPIQQWEQTIFYYDSRTSLAASSRR